MYLILWQIKGSHVSTIILCQAPVDMKLQIHGLLSSWAPLFLQKKERRRRVSYSPVIIVSPSHTQDHKQHSRFLFSTSCEALPTSCLLLSPAKDARAVQPWGTQGKEGPFLSSWEGFWGSWEGAASVPDPCVPKPRVCIKAIPHLWYDAARKYCSLGWTQPLNCPILYRPGQRIENNLGMGLYSRISDGGTMYKVIFLY